MNSALSHKLTLYERQPDQSSDQPLPLQAPQAPRRGARIDALYMHIPFCFHKCHYCDFYSLVEQGNHEDGKNAGGKNSPSTKSDRQAPFTDSLIEELTHLAGLLDLRPRTLFVGGGTPTLLRPELWEKLLAALDSLNISQGLEEFTVECNPETITPELARILVQGGVGRVSIGAQSFHPPLLKMLERWHEPASVPRAANLLREAGIRQVNFDLIFAIPGQTMAMLESDIDQALALSPDHLSCYGLTYEPQTAMTQRLAMGQFNPAEEDLEKQMYEYLLDRLNAEGFEQYEVSNWARRSPQGPRVCEHNMAYWQNLNWVGAGPGAGSHVDGWRWKNLPHLSKYMAGVPQPPRVDVQPPDEQMRIGDMLMLGLRLRQGVTLDWYEASLAPADTRRGEIQHMLKLGFMEKTDTHLRLTRKGLLVADTIISRLL